MAPGLGVLSSDENEHDAAGGAGALAPAWVWESTRSMSSSSFTPHVSTTQMRQLVTGNARTVVYVTHLDGHTHTHTLSTTYLTVDYTAVMGIRPSIGNG